MNTFGKLDRQQLIALVRCSSPEMASLVPLFEKVLDDTKAALVRTDDLGHFQRLQGRAQVIEDFLEAVSSAPSVLERLR